MSKKSVDIKGFLTDVKNLAKDHPLILTTLAVTLAMAARGDKEQLKQIEACQEAFKMNVERDEDLLTALSESANPWNG